MKKLLHRCTETCLPRIVRHMHNNYSVREGGRPGHEFREVFNFQEPSARRP